MKLHFDLYGLEVEMRYNKTVLTDENFDEEMEKLAEIIGIPFTCFKNFVKELDSSFAVRTHDLGFDEWACVKIINQNPSISEAYEDVYLAYEFGNGFMIFHSVTLL